MIFEFIPPLHTDDLNNRCNLSRYRRSREMTRYDIGRLSANCFLLGENSRNEIVSLSK